MELKDICPFESEIRIYDGKSTAKGDEEAKKRKESEGVNAKISAFKFAIQNQGSSKNNTGLTTGLLKKMKRMSSVDSPGLSKFSSNNTSPSPSNRMSRKTMTFLSNSEDGHDSYAGLNDKPFITMDET